MARSASVIVTDDLDGSENAETVSFSVGGLSYGSGSGYRLRLELGLSLLSSNSTCNHGHVSTDYDLPAEVPDGQDARPRLLVWQDELNTSPGHRAIALMDYVRRIGYVFQANVAQ